jgi:hypothetical protein
MIRQPNTIARGQMYTAVRHIIIFMSSSSSLELDKEFNYEEFVLFSALVFISIRGTIGTMAAL